MADNPHLPVTSIPTSLNYENVQSSEPVVSMPNDSVGVLSDSARPNVVDGLSQIDDRVVPSDGSNSSYRSFDSPSLDIDLLLRSSDKIDIEMIKCRACSILDHSSKV